MDRNELRRLLLFAAAVLALCFVYLAYRPALHAAFIWDDHAFVQSGASYQTADLRAIWTRSFWPESPFADTRVPYYRPLVLLSYRFDLSLGGTPVEFHFTNVALHLVTCVFLGIVAVRLGASIASAILAAVVWGVAPRLTEDVAWIAGRTDVLAAFFGFAALAMWPEISTVSAETKGTRARSLGAGVLLFLACASKEIGLAFAGAMIAAVLLRQTNRKRAAIALGVPLALYFALRTLAFSQLDIPPSRELGFGRRVLTVFEAIERYAEMTIDPVHPRTSIGMLGEPDGTRAAIGVVLLLACLALMVFVVRRGSFRGRFTLVLGLLAVAPIIQVLPLPLTSAVVADRLLYVPLAALALALTSLRHRAFAVSALGLALVFAATTNARARDYTEETEFWTIAAENAHPHNTAARTGLARWLVSAGEPQIACPLYERSLAILDAQGLQSRPPHQRARENLASCWVRIGRYEDAVRMNRELARDFPAKARVFLELGFAELHVRNFDGAATAFATASRLEGGALAAFVISNAELATIRADVARFDQLTRFQQATNLLDLGRATDASEAYFAIAMDAGERASSRQAATGFLMEHGPFEQATKALAVVPPPIYGWATKDELEFAHRRAVRRALEPLRGRIDALMR